METKKQNSKDTKIPHLFFEDEKDAEIIKRMIEEFFIFGEDIPEEKGKKEENKKG